MKPPGITPPLIAFSNSSPLPASPGEISMLAVGELAAAARLLLVAGVGLGGLADRLHVGHLRRLQRDLGPEALLHPLDDDLDVDLGQPGDDLLARLRVAVDVERRVLLAQPADRGAPPSPRRPWTSARRRRPSPAPAAPAPRRARLALARAQSRSPAVVSFSFATAPMSPAPSSSSGSSSLPCGSPS